MTVNGEKVEDGAVEKGATVTFTLESNLHDNLFGKNSDGTYLFVEEWIQEADEEGNLKDAEPKGNFELIFHDQMSKAYTGRTDPVVTIEKTVDGKTTQVPLDVDYYTVKDGDEAENPCTFHIVMDLLQLYRDKQISLDQIKAGAKITVTYNAKFDPDTEEKATKGAFTNKAWVTGKDVSDTSSEVEADLFHLTVTKTNTADSPEPLKGASFMLYKDEEMKKPVLEEAKPTGEDGTVTFEGLVPGTYYLYETAAPSGYVRIDKAIPVKVNKTTDAADKTADFVVNDTVKNSQAPHTGGAGTMLYTAGGAALLAGALAIAVTRKKKEQSEK